MSCSEVSDLKLPWSKTRLERWASAEDAVVALPDATALTFVRLEADAQFLSENTTAEVKRPTGLLLDVLYIGTCDTETLDTNISRVFSYLHGEKQNFVGYLVEGDEVDGKQSYYKISHYGLKSVNLHHPFSQLRPSENTCRDPQGVQHAFIRALTNWAALATDRVLFIQPYRDFHRDLKFAYHAITSRDRSAKNTRDPEGSDSSGTPSARSQTNTTSGSRKERDSDTTSNSRAASERMEPSTGAKRKASENINTSVDGQGNPKRQETSGRAHRDRVMEQAARDRSSIHSQIDRLFQTLESQVTTKSSDAGRLEVRLAHKSADVDSLMTRLGECIQQGHQQVHEITILRTEKGKLQNDLTHATRDLARLRGELEDLRRTSIEGAAREIRGAEERDRAELESTKAELKKTEDELESAMKQVHEEKMKKVEQWERAEAYKRRAHDAGKRLAEMGDTTIKSEGMSSV